MMRLYASISLLAIAVRAHAVEKDTMDTVIDKLSGKLMDKMFDRVLDALPMNTEGQDETLDDATLGKPGALAVQPSRGATPAMSFKAPSMGALPTPPMGPAFRG